MKLSTILKLSKILHLVCCLVFIVPICMMALLYVLLPHETVLANEQRVAKMPAFSVEALFSGHYFPEVEAYFSDTFPFRTQLFAANANLAGFYAFSPSREESALVSMAASSQNLDMGMGTSALGEYVQVPPEPDAVPEEETGWGNTISPHWEEGLAAGLLDPEKEEAPPPPPVIPEFNSTAEENKSGTILLTEDRAMEIFSYSEARFDEYATIINAMKAAVPEDVRVFSLVAPTSVEYYAPPEYREGRRSVKMAIEALQEKLQGPITVDAWTELAYHVDEYIYLRTDHHWTARGAYYAYVALCRSAGFKPVQLEDFKTGQYDDFLGTMYQFLGSDPRKDRLLTNKDYIEYFVPIVETEALVYANTAMENGRSIAVVNEAFTGGNKYLCFIAGDNPLTHITTSQKNGKSIVVLKESYGNAFVPFLTAHYENIYVVDLRTFNGPNQPSFNLANFVNDHQVNDVLVINYAFSASNPSIQTGLRNMVP